MTKRKDILRGIAAYKEAQKELLRTIRQYGGKLHQDDFDREFASSVWHRRDFTPREQKAGQYIDDCGIVRPIEFKCLTWPVANETRRKYALTLGWPLDPDAFMLGSPWQGQYGRWLHLLRYMVRAGLVKTEGKPPNVVYLTEKPIDESNPKQIGTASEAEMRMAPDESKWLTRWRQAIEAAQEYLRGHAMEPQENGPP